MATTNFNGIVAIGVGLGSGNKRSCALNEYFRKVHNVLQWGLKDSGRVDKIVPLSGQAINGFKLTAIRSSVTFVTCVPNLYARS